MKACLISTRGCFGFLKYLINKYGCCQYEWDVALSQQGQNLLSASLALLCCLPGCPHWGDSCAFLSAYLHPEGEKINQFKKKKSTNSFLSILSKLHKICPLPLHLFLVHQSFPTGDKPSKQNLPSLKALRPSYNLMWAATQARDLPKLLTCSH